MILSDFELELKLAKSLIKWFELELNQTLAVLKHAPSYCTSNLMFYIGVKRILTC